MNNKFLFSLLCLLLTTSAFFSSCSDDDKPSTDPIGIKSVAITNAGEKGDERIEATLEGDVFKAKVSALTDMKALRLEIVANEGTSTTPASGSVINFEENNGTQTVIATRGTETKSYSVQVTKDALANELAITDVKVSGVYQPEVVISQTEKTIHLTFTDILGTTAVLSDFKINPSSATIKSSSPAISTSDDGEYMEIDFSATGEKNIVIANGSEEKKYVITATITETGFKPESENIVFDQTLGGNLNPMLGTNNTRGAYFDGRYVYFASREGGNNIYYYDINDATKEMKSLNMGTDVIDASGTTWAISDIRVADNGGIYVNSMAMSKDGKFKVYYWADVNAEPVKVLEYTLEDPVAPSTAVRLGDALSIVGDPQSSGYIAASNFPNGNANQGQIYMWEYKNGTAVSGEPVIVDLVGQFTGASASDPSLGQYARISSIPGDNAHYIVTGASCGLLIVDQTFKVVYELPRDTPIQGRAMDPHFFEYNGMRYLTYTVNREWTANDAYIEVVSLAEGDNFIEGLKTIVDKSIEDVSVYKKFITTNATNGAVWVASSNSVKVVNDKVYIFGFTCEYGALAVEFSK